MLRHSLIAAAFALATIRLRGSQATRHLRTSRAIRATARSCTPSPIIRTCIMGRGPGPVRGSLAGLSCPDRG